MRRRVYGSLALLMLIAGCDTSLLAPRADQTVALRRSGAAGPLQSATSAPSNDVHVLPASSPSASSASPSPTPSDATATASAAAQTRDASTTSAPTTLGAATANADTFRLIPVIGDDGTVGALLTDPQDGLVTWNFQASSGATTLQIAAIRLVLQSVACRPGPALPTTPPGASITVLSSGTPPVCAATASDAQGASGTQSASTTPVASGTSLVVQSWPATTIRFTPAAVKCPTSLAPGASGALTLSLQDPAVLAFMRANYGSAQVRLTLTPLDAAGNPLPSSSGQSFVITQMIQVL